MVGVHERPDVVLSMHIVAGPAAALLRRQLGIPFVQYIHAKEVGARPALARFALTRADRVIAVSHYTRDLALAAGANPGRDRADLPGRGSAAGVASALSARAANSAHDLPARGPLQGS